jgi:hypothetical protein
VKTGLYIVFLVILCSSMWPASAFPESPVKSRRLYRVTTTTPQGETRSAFIDKTGAFVIGFDRFPPNTSVWEFSEGLAQICFLSPDEGLCSGIGFIDETGEIVLRTDFGTSLSFKEGLAYVASGEVSGYIDRTGKMVIRLKPDEQRASDFSEGMAMIWKPNGHTFIDRSGRIVIDTRFAHAEPFSEGLAAVSIARGEREKYGFINKNGKMVIPPRFDPIVRWTDMGAYGLSFTSFSQGVARVRVGKLWGYIDKKGDFVIPPRFSDAADFSEGLACVVEGGKAGFVDKSGRWRIKPRFQAFSIESYSFRQGMSPAIVLNEKGNGQFGFIDRTGRMIIEPRFGAASPFNDEGVALVYEIDQSRNLMVPRYIDTTGKYLWKGD